MYLLFDDFPPSNLYILLQCAFLVAFFRAHNFNDCACDQEVGAATQESSGATEQLERK